VYLVVSIATVLLAKEIRQDSSITAYLDLSDGNVRDARLLSGHAKLETLVIYDDRRKNVQGKVSRSLADLV
jgi:integrase/recombinase XerC